tara:strand:+ start:2659 stop:3219 length:561 start_codon:yes stop_codon:yes gene_type:complete
MNNIPNFDHNQVLPPYLGTPTNSKDLSPYPCTTLELCEKYAYTRERIEILKGFINFRNILNQLNILDGFQWLDGSFLENIEQLENRPPNDLDLVTFYKGIDIPQQQQIAVKFPEFSSSQLSKQSFKIDHYPVDYGYNPDVTVEITRYWLQLFSHKRNSVWKGMLRIELNTPKIDLNALNLLNNSSL